MSAPPEFSHLIPLDRARDLALEVEADAAQRAAVAARLRLVSLERLRCHFQLRPLGRDRVEGVGHLRAAFTQTCGVSAEAFPAEVDERFIVVFTPEDQLRGELDLDAADEVPYSARGLDLGEAATEQLGLALDSFPRKPGLETPEEAETPANSPFAALGELWRDEKD